jgi:transposase
LPAREEVIYYSTRKTRWLLWKAEEELSERERAYVATLTQLCPPIAEAQRLLTTFHAILTQRCSEQLEPWLEQCEQSGISELVGFARGLRRDEPAVQAALRYAWSHDYVAYCTSSLGW